VKLIYSPYVTFYKLLKLSATKLTLSYREVANDFREEVKQARTVSLVRDVFSPSFAGKEAKYAH